MERDDGRYCDGCGQKLPAGAKLARATVTEERARLLGSAAPVNEDGTVTIDLCLACRIRGSEAART